MPIKIGLVLVAVIGADDFHPEGKYLDDIINKIDDRFLGVLGINFQRPDTC
jgi:hypothetical protein